MRKLLVPLGVVLLLSAAAAAIVPMWTMSAGIGMGHAGYVAVVLMVIFCFAMGGGLMFLVFFSSRRGYDEAAHHGGGHRDWRPAGEDEGQP